MRRLLLLSLLALMTCARPDAHSQAARLDRRFGTHVYTWLLEHDPSRLDIAGAPPADVGPFVLNGSVRVVSAPPKAACALARRHHALMLAFVRQGDRERREALRDCGFAVERDAAALIIAPE